MYKDGSSKAGVNPYSLSDKLAAVAASQLDQSIHAGQANNRGHQAQKRPSNDGEPDPKRSRPNDADVYKGYRSGSAAT